MSDINMKEIRYYDLYDREYNVIAAHLSFEEIHEITGIDKKSIVMYAKKGILKSKKWRVDNSYTWEMLEDWDRTRELFKRTGGRYRRMRKGW